MASSSEASLKRGETFVSIRFWKILPLMLKLGVVSHPQKIRAWIKDFINMMQFECGAASNTLISYERDLRKFVDSLGGDREVCEIMEADVVKHSRAMHSLSKSTRRRHISSLRRFFNFLRQEGVLNRDLAKDISIPHEESLPKTAQPAEISRLFAIAESKRDKRGVRMLCILELLYSTGIRVSELVSLPYPLYFIEGDMLKIKGKGGKERLVCINGSAVSALGNYLEIRKYFDIIGSSKWLFPSRGRQSHITRHRVFQLMKDLAKEAGVSGVSPHTIRHTFATHLLEGGADLISIRNLLGHASVDSTQIYTHVDSTRKVDVVRKYHPLSEMNRAEND